MKSGLILTHLDINYNLNANLYQCIRDPLTRREAFSYVEIRRPQHLACTSYQNTRRLHFIYFR